ncbi:hypothetical protein ABID82_002304 [Methylobacterium sp. PvP062]|uniref:Uncharacterized protein n=1 Tax=Methylobacterium radiotolerans TaxID=31998 RepID=A0ABV2NN20_9HYPH|nr:MULTISPECIES: hypothetical protein [unclassified Methylobacterium]MBP2495363.1 hypothetical protein [Methylobacterium sp. PvP105]MBP2504766.1 hypothetical protein [Methylobacterium sp. PvP109]MCX7335774.1 hypothetical protein [Hyphomicrobiales bacterium]
MIDDTDPVLAAVAALRAAGIKAIPTGHDMELWQIGNLIYSDADVLRLAESRGLVDGGDAR